MRGCDDRRVRPLLSSCVPQLQGDGGGAQAYSLHLEINACGKYKVLHQSACLTHTEHHHALALCLQPPPKRCNPGSVHLSERL